MIFSHGRHYMAMQGCTLILRAVAQKSIDIFEEPENSLKF